MNWKEFPKLLVVHGNKLDDQTMLCCVIFLQRIDAVVVDRSQGSRIFNDSPWSTWSDVEGAADKWAEGIRAALDEAHGR